MKVVFHGVVVHHLADTLLRKLKTTWQVERFLESDPPEAFARAVRDADALISMRWDRSFPAAPRLRLIQLPGTGYDGVDFGALPESVALCNCYGHAEGMAEYTFLGMLVWCHRFIDADRTFRHGSWEYSGRINGPINLELYGSTLGIVGYGSIGHAVAGRARAFGMRVVAINRTRRDKPACVDEWHGLNDLDRILPRLDYVVVAAALGPETEGLIGPAQFALMKPSAVLLNVGRGPIVQERALYDALKTRRIRGATIDVWYGSYPSPGDPHPAPSRLPFHELDNLYMTPHSSGWTTGMVERRWDQIAANLDRLARGEPLEHRLR